MGPDPLERLILSIRGHRVILDVANQTILKRLAEIDRTLLQHDGALKDLYRKLMPLLQPEPEGGKGRKLGFSRESA